MDDGLIPFLWLCGPSGVGKSSVGWEIFARLDRAGVRSAYVDTDQLGMCYPAPDDDPGNDRIKARNLGLVWSNFRAAGVRCFVVSGGVDTQAVADTYTDQVPGTALTLCRLRVGHAELRQRFLHRNWLPEQVDAAVEEADRLDHEGFGDVCVDTDGLSIPKVADLVRERAGGWPW